MSREILELRILPPLAIGRLGSSPDPMDNYELTIPDPIGPRVIVPAETLIVNRKTAEARKMLPRGPMRFRDPDGRIRPIAPFLEVWVRFRGEAELQPLTVDILKDMGLQPESVCWRAHVANLKIFRHTTNKADRIEARTGFFNDHAAHPLRGECPNFLEKRSISLGSVQYIAPSPVLPEIRLRFTPASGRVYGPASANGKDPNIADAVYDDSKGKGTWKGYSEPNKSTLAPNKGRLLTHPKQIFAGATVGEGEHSKLESFGYFDDECDGIVEVKLHVSSKVLGAFARIAAGPPTFAPDSFPVRTVGDELEQAMFGPHVDLANESELCEARDVVRRALETVRLMNTGQMNKASHDRGVGMARMDSMMNRALEPIFEPSVADSLAIRARHERVLLALEGGSLVWFARVLRDYDKTGDISTEGRRKMPALLRGADGMYLALTRRQAAKIRAAAEYVAALHRKEKHEEPD